MNEMQFQAICAEAARALRVEATGQEDRRSLTIDGVDVLIDLDEEADALLCYVDLGDADPHARLEVCEQLLALNLRTHSNHHGTYAFEPVSGRAIFCATLLDATTLDGNELAEMFRYYVNETAAARQIVRGITPVNRGMLLLPELA